MKDTSVSAMTDEKSCLEKLRKEPPPLDGNLYCNGTWDMLTCIPHIAAGETKYLPCPPGAAYVNAEKAFRTCTVNGTWWKDPEDLEARPKTNYLQCSRDDTHVVVTEWLYRSGFSLSLVCLLVAIFTFLAFRQLHCERISVHKNLFVSYAFVCIVSLINHLAVDYEIAKENPGWCQAVHVLWVYFTQCNYFWMFAEGIYLHTSLLFTFVSSKKILFVCYGIGWGIPLLVTVPYIGLRVVDPNATIMCWMGTHHWQFLIVAIPPTLTVVLNLGLVINIIRILVTKLRAVNTPDTGHIRKTVRATAILIPLLGLHQILILAPSDDDLPYIFVYQFFAAIIISTQGFLVATIYCFFNGEVISLVKRKWRQRYPLAREARPSSLCGRTASLRLASTDTETRKLSLDKSAYEMIPLNDHTDSIAKQSDVRL